MHRICLCPASIAWIRKHLMKSARSTFNKLLVNQSIHQLAKSGKLRVRGKPRR